MTPGRVFGEVLESHELRSSDSESSNEIKLLSSISFMSDNANLLDIMRIGKVRRLHANLIAISAAMG
jgi:hypothetical protein